MKHTARKISALAIASLALLAFVACEGQQGPQGERGERGPQGEGGPQGERGLQGVQGLEGSSGTSFPTSIMLFPPQVEEGRPRVNVLGSGWQPDEAVTLEVYGPDGYYVFIGGGMADQAGTFEIEIRPRSRETEGGPFGPGLHSVLALGSKDGGASSPLMVTVAAE